MVGQDACPVDSYLTHSEAHRKRDRGAELGSEANGLVGHHLADHALSGTPNACNTRGGSTMRPELNCGWLAQIRCRAAPRLRCVTATTTAPLDASEDPQVVNVEKTT